MSHGSGRPKPTRINTRFIGGVVYHYDRISEEALRSLGIGSIPPEGRGRTTKVGGVTIRRLKSGLLNVTVWPGSKLLRDEAVDRFMAALRAPLMRRGRETARQAPG